MEDGVFAVSGAAGPIAGMSVPVSACSNIVYFARPDSASSRGVQRPSGASERTGEYPRTDEHPDRRRCRHRRAGFRPGCGASAMLQRERHPLWRRARSKTAISAAPSFSRPRAPSGRTPSGMKLNPHRQHGVRGKRVVLVDDSIVRGHQPARTSSRLLREAGAKEVHMRALQPAVRGTLLLRNRCAGSKKAHCRAAQCGGDPWR